MDNKHALWYRQPGAPAAYRAARDALFQRDYKRGNEDAQGYIGEKHNYDTNLPVGRLVLDFGSLPEISGYSRSLDIGSALSQVEFSSRGNTQSRDVCISNPNQVLVCRV